MKTEDTRPDRGPLPVRIVSDGTPRNTHVFVGGEELRHVMHVSIDIGADDALAKVTLTLLDVDLQLEGLAEVARK